MRSRPKQLDNQALRTIFFEGTNKRYIGQLFRDRNLLQYLTVDRIPSSTLHMGLLFFLFALKNVGALTPDDLDMLYTRFIVESDQEMYWRAWWDGVRHVIVNLDTCILRNTILSQIQRTEWRKFYFQPDASPNAVTGIISSIIDATKEYTTSLGAPIPGWDCMPVIRTVRFLLRAISANDVDDPAFRSQLTECLYRLFPYYPTTGDQRHEIAEDCFKSASTGPMEERLGDLQVLRTLVMADSADFVTGWKREDCVHRLCMFTPSLPEVILEELAGWKRRQYMFGLENAERAAQIQVRVQLLMLVLGIERNPVDGFRFPREVLEDFWNTALMRTEDGGNDQYWGGDLVTEHMRLMLFHTISTTELRRSPALVASSTMD
jgi:hypothetical protein